MDNTADFQEFVEYFITFRSVTMAQRAKSVLDDGIVPSTLMRTPQAMAAKGCGYGLRLKQGRLAAGELLKRNQVPYSKVYGKRKDGSYQEIRL